MQLSGLWLTGLIYYFVTAPAAMRPLPVTAGWIVIITTIVALFVLSRRYPWFALFLMGVISTLMSGGRSRRRW